MPGAIFGGEAPANGNNDDLVDYTLSFRATPDSARSVVGVWVRVATSLPAGPLVVAVWDGTGTLLDSATIVDPVAGTDMLGTFTGGPYAWPSGDQWSFGYYTTNRYVFTGSRLPTVVDGITVNSGHFHENSGGEAGTPVYPNSTGNATWYGIDIELGSGDTPVSGSDSGTLADAAAMAAILSGTEAATLADLAAMAAALDLVDAGSLAEALALAAAASATDSGGLAESASRTVVGAARVPGRPAASSSAATITAGSGQ